MNDKTLGAIYALLCVALWALIPVVAKTGQTRLDNNQFLFWSSLVSSLTLLTITALSGKLGEISKYSKFDWVKLPVLGALGTYVYYLFLYLGYSKSTGMEALAAQYTWPFLIVLFSALILRERFTLRKLVSVALGFGGVMVILAQGDLSKLQAGNFSVIGLVLAGSCCFALFSVLSKPINHEPAGVTSIYFLTALVASFISMSYSSRFALPAKADMLPILANGILVNGISYLIWLRALSLTDASHLAPYTFITPALSAIYLTAFFDEQFLPSYGIGIALIVIGGLVNSLSFKNGKDSRDERVFP